MQGPRKVLNIGLRSRRLDEPKNGSLLSTVTDSRKELDKRGLVLAIN